MDIAIKNNDCLVEMKAIRPNSINLILTDPPYNLGLFMKERQTNLGKMRDNFFGSAGWDNLEYDEWAENMGVFFEESYRVLRPGGAMIVFMSIIKVESIISLALEKGFYYKTTGIWHKTNPMPRNMNLHFVNSNECWIYFLKESRTGVFNNNGKLILDYFESSVTPQSEKKWGKHPTQKPLKLMEHFISILSNEGDIILDPFMGSGSTGVGSIRLNRKFIGFEIDKNYYNIAKRRLEEEISYEGN